MESPELEVNCATCRSRSLNSGFDLSVSRILCMHFCICSLKLARSSSGKDMYALARHWSTFFSNFSGSAKLLYGFAPSRHCLMYSSLSASAWLNRMNIVHQIIDVL